MSILWQGAQDRQQEIVMRDLQGEKAAALKAQLEEGTPGVFTCGSPQLLGHYYEPAFGQRIDGLGLLDLVSKHPGPDAKRCIGNVVFEITAEPLASDLKKLLLGLKIMADVPISIACLLWEKFRRVTVTTVKMAMKAHFIETRSRPILTGHCYRKIPF
jgi:hypothetical protein